MSRAPLIGMNMGLLDMEEPLKAKAFCHLKYIDAVTAGGGIPVIVPPFTDRTQLDAVLDRFDGFCLIGGPDYLPESYGGHPQPPSDLMHPRRHHFDLWLAEAILERTRKPVLGICGGHQLINIALGGGLVQDIPSEWRPAPQQACTLLHSDSQRQGTEQAGNVYRHALKVTPNSLVARICGNENLLSNSFHHQAVDPARLGRGLTATAWSPDGVIEAIEPSDGNRFVLGVQWHPERQCDEPRHRALFEALAAAARG